MRQGREGKQGKQVSPVAIGVALGWGILVILAVQGIQTGLNHWKMQNNELSQLKRRLVRLQGWLRVESQVRSHRDEVLGPFSSASSTDLGWLGLAKIEELAKTENLAVTELRPSRWTAPGKKEPQIRLDVKLEGEVERLGRFLKAVPERIPGVKLSALQIVPLEGARSQMIVRLALAEAPPLPPPGSRLALSEAPPLPPPGSRLALS